MINLKEAAKNPAYTLSAMLYGLQNPIETKDVRYEVDMETFGSISEDGSVCYGCAATSALEVITGHSFAENVTPDFINDRVDHRAKLFGTTRFQTDCFEQAVDFARRGHFNDLMRFFCGRYNDDQYNYYGVDLCITSFYWEGAVPSFEKLIEIMHEDYPDWERFTAPGEQENRIINLKQAAKNPAYSLGAMIYGLQNPISTKDVEYKLEMGTSGCISLDRTICYGCASTSTLEVITGRSLAEYVLPKDAQPHPPLWRSGSVPSAFSVDRSDVFDVKSSEIDNFGYAIDLSMHGIFHELMTFFGYSLIKKYKYEDMGNNDWRSKVPEFENIINEMHEDYPDWERFTAPGEMT